jgi:hypothetical protein
VTLKQNQLVKKKVAKKMNTDSDECCCLGLGCVLCRDSSMEPDSEVGRLRAARAAIRAACAVEKNDQSWTHTDSEGKRYKLSAMQEHDDAVLYHRLWLATNGDEQPLSERTESIAARMQRVDEAVNCFLNSSEIVRVPEGRVSHADFAKALRQTYGLRHCSQHAISQAARRAGLKCLASHAARFWVGIKLT